MVEREESFHATDTRKGWESDGQPTLDVRQDEPVSWLTLNRPEALNALNRAMVEELRDYFGRLPSDTATRVVVLRGAGRAFCAGLDLKEGGGDNGTVQGGMRGRQISELVMLMRRAPQPFIACVQGAACGGRISRSSLVAQLRRQTPPRVGQFAKDGA